MDDFLRALRSSGLISENTLTPLLDHFQNSDVVSGRFSVVLFAALLVEKGELTCWQCARLCEGRFKGFFCDEYKIMDHVCHDQECSYYLAEALDTGRRVVLAFHPDKTGVMKYEVLKHF
jgi:hypothetical protein